MSKKILMVSNNEIFLLNENATIWNQHRLTICKKDTFDDATAELKTDYHYLLLIAMNRENTKDVHEQVKIFRTMTAAPIAIVTEEPVNVDLKIAMLNDGVDRFFIFPMPHEELAAEFLALIRRFAEPCNIAFQQNSHFYSHGLIIDIDRRMVIIGKQEIELKKYEFDILSMLAKGNGRVYSGQQIYEEVWKEDSRENANALVQTQICRLREKIQINPKQPNYIKTHYGTGYSFRPEYDTD